MSKIDKRFSAFDNIPWILSLLDFTKKALLHHRIRAVGLCFGHQIIGRALGASGGPNSNGSEMSVCSIDLTPAGQRLFGKSQLAVHQMHHDSITYNPKNVVSLGSSSICGTQGMTIPEKLISLQGHPEFDGEIMLHLLEATEELGFEDSSLLEDALNRVNDPHDAEVIAATFLRFIRGDFDE
ncbi:MAG: hypothetical protein M1820_007201 [Bogoriella megaspora]|nr:MAG: hypothetical protein M1820_007201 [Bogoriella megaspora]